MSLRGLTVKAVERLKTALGDLAIDMTLKTRTKNAYVPGASITYAESEVPVKGVITKYRADEVDGTMIKKEDYLVIVFPPTNKAIPQPNDVLENGSTELRIVSNNPMFIGSEIAFNLVQARPPA